MSFKIINLNTIQFQGVYSFIHPVQHWQLNADKELAVSFIHSFAQETFLKPIIHLATFFARREAKTRIWQHDWLKLAGEKIRREQVGSVPTFLSVRANKFAKWKIGLKPVFH